MDLFDKVNCIIGDSFFFHALEQTIEKTLMDKYNVLSINKEFVLNDDPADKLNQALFPNMFDMEPKLVILRNVKNKFVSYAISNLKHTNNIYLIIEIEKEKYDSRIKIFQDLDKNQCIIYAGFAFYDKKDKMLDVAYNKMEELLKIEIPGNVRKFIADYVPKTEYDNRPIHNLNRIYHEIKKISLGHKEITLELCKNMITYQQIYYNIFDITQALADDDIEKAMRIIDACVMNINDARKILSLILSEIKIICSICSKTNTSFDILYEDMTKNISKYEMLEDSNKEEKDKKIHPYRLKKILEKKNTKYFKNCHNNLKLCLAAYNDLNYYYLGNFRIPIIKLCLDMH